MEPNKPVSDINNIKICMGYSAFIHPCPNTIIFTDVPILPSDVCGYGCAGCVHACMCVVYYCKVPCAPNLCSRRVL